MFPRYKWEWECDYIHQGAKDALVPPRLRGASVGPAVSRGAQRGVWGARGEEEHGETANLLEREERIRIEIAMRNMDRSDSDFASELETLPLRVAHRKRAPPTAT